MAGIVASTLRRRTLRHHKIVLNDTKYQAIDPGHISLSPTASHPPSRSPSFGKGLSRTPSGSGYRSPHRTRLQFHTFWPTCINPLEQNIRNVQFETFDTLVPKANSWLQENTDIHLIKCETIEKKVCTVHDLTQDSSMFTAKGANAIYVKGLRLWYFREREGSSSSEEDKKAENEQTPIEIGYMNVIPKCIDSNRKYPLYENLPETYAAVNQFLKENPLDGKILAIETVPLKLPHRKWQGPEVDPDQTYWPDTYLRHLLYITRIYFVYGPPEEETIGAEDFLPDFLSAPKWYRMYGIYPKYAKLISAMQKAKNWIQTVENVRIANIQTLETLFRGNADFVQTGLNFVDKIESCTLVRFVRVTYVKNSSQSSETSSSTYYRPPSGFAYKTFIPSPIKVGMCSGTPEYEPFSLTWQRAKVWMRIVDRKIIGAETFYHPISYIWHKQDGTETTVMDGEWNDNNRGDRRQRSRKQLVQVIRIYTASDYSEPPAEKLPPLPGVEEYNDCACVVM